MKSREQLQEEIYQLRSQLEEANETIQAIRTGEVDALVVHNGHGHQIYTLKSADQAYRVFIEKMKEGAVTLNKDGTILYSNSQFADMVHLPLGKIIGLPFKNFISENYKDFFQSLMEEGWRSDSKGEIYLIDGGNKSTPFLLSFTSVELDEGEALIIILTNLSQQKETENKLTRQNEELKEARQKAARMNEELENIVQERTKDLSISREHFKFLADNIPVMVWMVQSDGKPEYFNKRWYEYTGFEDGQVSTEVLPQKILHPDDIEAAMKAWEDAIAGETKFEFEYRVRRHADGQYRWHLAYAVPLKDTEGKLLTWIGTSTDIEDQKKELEKKDEFIGVASHELKTPLTSLKGYIQLIDAAGENLPSHINQYVKKANESINKLQHLINDLLDVSKIQSGKLEFTMTPLDLAPIIHSCVENTTHMYSEYSIEAKIEDELFVNGNADRLEQVLMNLINNAVKYSPDNKKILVEAEKKNNEVSVSVIDCGIGLPEESKKKIFDRFYRVDDVKHLASGLGMGLFISAEIIKAHKGTMDVQSKLDHGSTFSFNLPAI